MANLIIIGNGFDLAHGLKTSYNDFILHILNSRLKNELVYQKLFEFKIKPDNLEHFHVLLKKLDIRQLIKSDNIFFLNLLSHSIEKNWYDIEQFYYDELLYTSVDDNSRFHAFGIEKLNSDFNQIKILLENYLTMQEKGVKPISTFNTFFSKLIEARSNRRNDLILNFNYTNTLNSYTTISNNFDIMHIHGELNHIKNPIVFGFAANLEENRVLLDKNDFNYLTNIKKHNYKFTRQEEVLKGYLSYNEPINIYILGHSIGLSDKLILNQIFNHKNIYRIKVFYHNNHLNYFKTQVNIDRIMDNDENFEKLESFEKALRMPQYKDNQKLNTEFLEKLKYL